MRQFILFLSLFVCALAEEPEKLNIDIFYESLCPDSLRFIKTQLYPSWNDISSFVNLKLIPFGKSASINEGAQFECQHGPKECMGNRLQSCVLNQITNQTAQVDYVNCFMIAFRKNDDKEVGETCAMNVGASWPAVKDCFENDLGTKLQLQAEIDTNNAKLKFVPTIFYNGKFDKELQDLSEKDFRSVVCDLGRKNNQFQCKETQTLHL